ncbi:MAG: hypothetical protein P4L81_02660, partial [Candidatus Pacebacteria bacterium]|nr:hypothetical protein [Candidatus Paceibacterota bacterium]
MTRAQPTQSSVLTFDHVYVTDHLQRMRLRIRGIDRSANIALAFGSEWEAATTQIPRFDCNPASDANGCFEFSLPYSGSTSMYDKDLTISITMSWRSTAAYYLVGEPATVYTVKFRLTQMLDTRLSALTAATVPLDALFTMPTSLAGSAYSYSLTLDHLKPDPPFEFDYTIADRYATYTVTYYPPLVTQFRPDNGDPNLSSPLSLTVKGTDHAGRTQKLTTLTSAYATIPFGRSNLVFTVTAEAGGTPSTYTIHISKMRHTNSAIASLISTLGRMTPNFDSKVTRYQVLMRVTDPTKQVRVMYSLQDAFATAAARIVDAAAAKSDPIAALGIKVEVRESKRSCNYQSMLQFVPIYGRSNLLLTVTADDGNTTLTRFYIDKVSFRLFNITA